MKAKKFAFVPTVLAIILSLYGVITPCNAVGRSAIRSRRVEDAEDGKTTEVPEPITTTANDFDVNGMGRDISVLKQYSFDNDPLNRDWDIVIAEDGPQITLKDGVVHYYVENQKGRNKWLFMSAKEKFGTFNGGCVLRFRVRANQIKSSEIKFTLFGDVILRWNGSSFSYQRWKSGFTRLGPSYISPDGQWHHIVMFVSEDAVSLFEDGAMIFHKDTDVGKVVTPLFHMQALDRGSNLSFELKDIVISSGVTSFDSNMTLSKQYSFDNDPLKRDWDIVTKDNGPQIKLNDGAVRYYVKNQKGRNQWLFMSAKEKFGTHDGGCVLRFSVRAIKVESSEIKFTLFGDVILRWDGSSFSYQRWKSGFTRLGPSSISPDGRWHHIVMVVSKDAVSLFEDGVESFNKDTDVEKVVTPLFHMQALDRGSKLFFELKDIVVSSNAPSNKL